MLEKRITSKKGLFKLLARHLIIVLMKRLLHRKATLKSVIGYNPYNTATLPSVQHISNLLCDMRRETVSKASGKDISQIDFHSIRAGDISSTHTVLFGAMGERLEVTHRTYNWECCARGAIEAARFLSGKPAGAYTMEDVVKI